MRHLVRSVGPGVCRIICPDIAQSGTGFFVRDDGILLTSYHIVTRFERTADGLINLVGSSNIVVETEAGTYRGAIIHSAESTHPWIEDYAVLRIDATDTPPLVLGNYDLVCSGDEVIVLGYPLGIPYLSAARGIISAKYRYPSHMARLVELHVIQLDVAINLGNSGGPVLDARTGHVIGIVSTRPGGGIAKRIEQLRRIPEVEGDPLLAHILELLEVSEKYSNVGIGFAVSIEYARRELNRLELDPGSSGIAGG